MLTTTNIAQLPSVSDVLTRDTQTVFLIPTFQRPYAWKKKQFDDLKEDFDKAQLHSPFRHYFAQTHLSEITNADWIGPNSGNLLVDWDSLDIKEICNAFKAATGSGHPPPMTTYLVIDGQQRLTTLYLLLFLRAVMYPTPTLRTGDFFVRSLPSIPRIILSSADDHDYFRDMLINLNALSPHGAPLPAIDSAIAGLSITSSSQQRLCDMARLLADYAGAPHSSAQVVEHPEIRIGLTELTLEYALTSFLTLNDRGKALTSLEKIKSLWIEMAITVTSPGIIPDIHALFGRLYRLADQCADVGLVGSGKGQEDAENLIVQLLYHWLDMTNGSHNIEAGPERVYEWFGEQARRARPATIQTWLSAANELHGQLRHLCDTYLLAPIKNTVATGCPDWDYHAVLVGLVLPRHLLALFLKFRALYAREWHDPFTITLTCDPALSQAIRDVLDQVRNTVLALNHPGGGVVERIATISEQISRCHPDGQPCPAPTTMLKVIERTAMLGWYAGANPRVGFVNNCALTFGPNYTNRPDAFLQQWYGFCDWNGPRGRYYIQGLSVGRATHQERYLLSEWERALGGNIHWHQFTGKPEPLELEHIMAAAWDPSHCGNWVGWGFANDTDFRDADLQSIGNKMLLWKSCNAAVGNDDPNVKAPRYNSCVPNINMVVTVGTDLPALGLPSPLFREYFRLRCAELAEFALRHFFARCP